MIKALILDYDDTLVDTRKVRTRTLRQFASERYQVELGTDRIDAAWGKPGLEFMRILFGDHESDEEDMWAAYNKLCTRHPNIFHNGAKEFLDAHHGRLLMAILTSSSSRRVETELNELRIPADLFVAVQTSEDTRVHKPDPAVFAPLLAKLSSLGVSAAECLYVGDALHDHTAAVNAGLRFIGMAHAVQSANQFREKGIPFVAGFAELQVFVSMGLKAENQGDRGFFARKEGM